MNPHGQGGRTAEDRPDRQPKGQDASLPQYSTHELFCGGREICLDHDGVRYRLKITKQGKLILNK